MYERGRAAEAGAQLRRPEVGCVTGEARYLRQRPGGGRRRRARVLGLRDPDQASRDGARLDGRRRRRHLRHPPSAVADAAGGRHQRLPEPAADRRGRLARRLRARGRLLRGDGRRHASRSTGAASASSAGAGARSSRRRGVLNPFRVGLFPGRLVSHKVLRWFSGSSRPLARCRPRRLLRATSLERWPVAGRWRHRLPSAALAVADAARPARACDGRLLRRDQRRVARRRRARARSGRCPASGPRRAQQRPGSRGTR